MRSLPDSTRALTAERPCFPVRAAQPPRRSFTPIARTEKRPGDLVFGNCTRKPELVA